MFLGMFQNEFPIRVCIGAEVTQFVFFPMAILGVVAIEGRQLTDSFLADLPFSIGV